ncbi:hypothetical protein [Streptomyces sp. NBC_00091]|uniref:hypothetical protein n=1 Tax=Streptomyces sp. NBC_00091 TaxID=2975648 RepID=UPI0022557982|nr:hypothetical protein [Streptomyces sp. NBC_00091]MCX5377775.1 hypothetical protein [Streptomyces sp. NBC_00091]
MSPIAMGGPALFIGSDTTYVALVRPELDPADPEVRLAAEQAGVSPEEFVGPGNVWALMWEQEEQEGGGFELPGLRDADADDFAERLLAELSFASEPFTVEAGPVLSLDGRPAGEDCAFLARITPPEGEEMPPLTVEIAPEATGVLRADLEEFRRSLV